MPRVDVLSDNCGGGVELRYMGMDGLATAAVMLAVEASSNRGTIESTQRGGEQIVGEVLHGSNNLIKNLGCSSYSRRIQRPKSVIQLQVTRESRDGDDVTATSRRELQFRV